LLSKYCRPDSLSKHWTKQGGLNPIGKPALTYLFCYKILIIIRNLKCIMLPKCYNRFSYVEVKILMILIPELMLNFIFVWSLDQIMTFWERGDFWKLFRRCNAGRNSTNENCRHTVLNE
uniref:Uncharacterized protein n=1 Tax=Phasianus colchicus TaxID=9054 RepID=A0A669Q360_PHACC